MKMRLLALLVSMSWSMAGFAGATEIAGWIEAPLQPQKSVAAAWIDLSESSLPRDPSRLAIVVRRTDADGAAIGEPLPSRLFKTPNGRQILWQVPGSPASQEVGKPRRFRFTITATDDAQAAQPSLAEEAANLVENGTFRETGPDGVPTGVTRFTGLELLKGTSENAIAFHGNAEGHGPVLDSPAFAVTEGQAYTVSFRYRIENARAHERYHLTLHSYLAFRDGQRNRAGRKPVFHTAETTSNGWKHAEATVTAPAGAIFGSVEIHNGSTVSGSVKVTDLRAAPVTIAKAKLDPGTTPQTAQATAGESRRFNFGTENALHWNGFSPASPEDRYTTEKGWGFTRITRPEAFDSLRPDGLARDCITADDAQFRVDLPNGTYDLWFLIGESTSPTAVQRYYFDQFLSANGRTLHELDPKPSEWIAEKWLRNYTHFWVPGMDYYETFIRPDFEEKLTQVEVTGGTLLIHWRNLPVSALMLQPVNAPVSIREAMAVVANDRRRDTLITETPAPESASSFTPSPDDLKRGFVIYRQGAEKPIHPTTVPAPEEVITGLETFAAPGQGEPVLFSLHALKDLDPVEIKVSGLTGENGTIPASALDLRVARYIHYNTNPRGNYSSYRYQLTGLPFDRRERLPVVKGTNWTWRIDIQVPEATLPGIYQGVVRMVNAGGELAALPLRVRIVPIVLDPLPILQGFTYTPSEPWYGAFWSGNLRGRRTVTDDPAILEQIRTNERREFAFMKSLGFNSMALSDALRGDLIYRDGEVTLRPDNRLDLWMELYREAGFGPLRFLGSVAYGPNNDKNNLLSALDPSLKPPFTEPWFRAYRSLVKNFHQYARSRNWPEIIWQVSDELSNQGRKAAERGARVAGSIADIPGVRTVAGMNGSVEEVMIPHLNIAMPNYGFPITRELVERLRQSGTEMWAYNCGDQRVALGLWTWRVGITGRYQYHYRVSVADPWNDAGGRGLFSKYCISYPGPDGPLPSVKSDAARAAITDHRYMVTLERLVEQSRNDPAKAAEVEAARAFIDDLRESLPIDPREMMGRNLDPRDSGGDLKSIFRSDDALQRIRWAIARHILKLQENPH
ncbi:MAG TPA: hypothetical protein VNQ90_18610 [Chthoniobacteraceae bacterium]|nr:hypothetical protein [Chthoniobacteraceae bacterium]